MIDYKKKDSEIDIENIEERRRRIAKRVNIISLIVVAMAGSVTVYLTGGQVDNLTQASVLAIILSYILFRAWRIWRS
ncbi:hypothetical protein JYT16_01630 [Gemmatimonas aurantiaca]|nr:hypothetical protein [Gemmatimonas aurantiaca]